MVVRFVAKLSTTGEKIIIIVPKASHKEVSKLEGKDLKVLLKPVF